MAKNIGIWMDLKKAYVIERESIAEIKSNVEDFHLHGGSGSSSPYGEQDATSETKLLERKKHQLKAYFKDVVDAVEEADNILLFGPAETKDEFLKMIKSEEVLFRKVLDVVTIDSVTDNQMKEFVRDYYKKAGLS